MLQQLIETLTFKGLEHFGRYYGVYRAIVFSNQDPEQRGRIQLFCPDIGQKTGNANNLWVDPAMDFAGKGHGSFFPPEPGDTVRVSYAYGDPSCPVIYWGGWYAKSALPAKLGYDSGNNGSPIKRGIVTTAGHALVFNDKSGDESVELSWKNSSAQLNIDKDGTVAITTGKANIIVDTKNAKIEIKDDGGSTITLDSNGISVKTASAVAIEGSGGVTVKGPSVNVDSPSVNLTSAAGEPAVLGTSLQAWLNGHVHGSGTGPTTPPTVLAVGSFLSKKAKLG